MAQGHSNINRGATMASMTRRPTVGGQHITGTRGATVCAVPVPAASEDFQLLTEKQLAEMTRQSMSFYRKRRYAGLPPHPVRCGRSIRYTLRNIREWLEGATASAN